MLEHSISCFRISNGPGSVSNNLILTLFVQNHKDNDVIESVQAANCTGLSQDRSAVVAVLLRWVCGDLSPDPATATTHTVWWSAARAGLAMR